MGSSVVVTLGSCDGLSLGLFVGSSVFMVGSDDMIGCSVGSTDGVSLGERVVGLSLGVTVGAELG